MSPGAITITVGLGFVAMAHCLYISINLLSPGNRLSNRILGLLLVAMAIRIGKSLVALYFPSFTFILSAIGLAVMSTIGPLLYLYFDCVINYKKEIHRNFSLHLIPAIMVSLMLSIEFSKTTLYIGYCLVNFQLGIYLILGYTILRTSFEVSSDENAYRWLKSLLLGSALILSSFVTQLLFDIDSIYLGAVLVSVVVIYMLSFRAKNYSSVFKGSFRTKKIPVHFADLARKVEALLLRDEAFADSTMTLSKISSRLMVPHHSVSQAINIYFNKSFPELLLHYRLQKAEQLLAKPDSGNIKIETIAYDSGFNSSSAFYAGFKKVMHLTPSEYREKVKLTREDRASV
jgi:AraC-like DNA-binding protein